MNDKLFIREIKLLKDKIEDLSIYPFNIDVIKTFENLKLESPVTFLIGENGVGKSTFIEALAIACNLNPEGGTQNFNFSTKNTHSDLYKYISLNKIGIPETKYFLRAESFYNVSSEIIRISEENYGGPIYQFYGGDLHECSHGEAFLKLIQNRFSKNGLYILDEPEAALSPTKQMTLLSLIHNLVENGSQFIISTHSPILIAYKNGIIYDLNNNFKKVKYEETDIYNIYKMFLERYDKMQEYLFDD